jgi:hypothetical protein
MIENTERFRLAMERIDSANAADPHQVSGVSSELLYSWRMTAWLQKLYPHASEPLRWEVPRSSYPMDRAGYHRWRTSLYSFHADAAAKILSEVGYDEPTIQRVRSMLKKERLKADAETQALEDVVCVVFLENYFADFAARHDEEKLIVILRRTWAKMSTVGQAAALKLPMSPAAAALVGKSLG